MDNEHSRRRKLNTFLYVITIVLLAGCNSIKTIQTPAPAIEIDSITPQPLEGRIAFTFEEVGGNIKLKFQTEKIYPVYNNELVATIKRSDSSIAITVLGVVTCRMRQMECLEAMGPARLEIELGEIVGEYELLMIYNQDKQAYHLEITPEKISLIPKVTGARFEPKYLDWNRIPENTIWFVTHNGGIYDGENWVFLEQPEYTQLSTEFFQEIERKGAIEFQPVEGHYSNRYFIAPWESWHESSSQMTKIDLDWDGYYEFKWPVIKYYEYYEEWKNVVPVVEEYNSYGVSIYGFSWNGEKIYAVKTTNDN